MAVPIYILSSTAYHSSNFSTHTHLTIFVLFIFLVISILKVVRLYLVVVFICISLIISDVQHFFMYLLVIICLLQKNVYSGHFAHFVSGVFVIFFCYWVTWIPSILWSLARSQIYDLQVVFPFHRLLFHLLTVSFAVKRFLVCY